MSLILIKYLKTYILVLFTNFSQSHYCTFRWIYVICLEQWVEFWHNHWLADIVLLTKYGLTINQKSYFNRVKKQTNNYSEILKISHRLSLLLKQLLYLTCWLPLGSPAGLLKIYFRTTRDTGGSQNYTVQMEAQSS